MGATTFIRNNNHEIIEQKRVLCIQEYNKLLEMYNRKLKAIEELENKINCLKIKSISKEDGEILKQKQEIFKKITLLSDADVYDHFTEFDFHAPKTGNLSFIPIVNKEHKEKQKHLNFALNIRRNAKRDSVMITLEEE